MAVMTITRITMKKTLLTFILTTSFSSHSAATLDGLAVDSRSRLLFYSDAGNDIIAMMTMSTLAHRTIINSSLDNPRAIVLDTTDGYVLCFTASITSQTFNDRSQRGLCVMCFDA